MFLIGALSNSNGQVRFGNDTIYKFSKSILKKLESKSPADFDRAAVDLSFIGDYQRALRFYAKSQRPFSALKREDSLYFKGFKPVDAKDHILALARDQRIIIINEAHHVPLHRIFTYSLLEGLYERGFRFFGCETLDWGDSLLNQRGYPTIHSGYYSVEPQYGNLIRKAIKLGFYVFAYEARRVETFSNPMQREIEQALNIARILEKDPDTRILIHAGYDHIREDSLGGGWFKAMAGRLKEFTGIDPLTINQQILTERALPELENPYYKMVDADGPKVFVKGGGEVFKGPVGTHHYDIRVFHPRTRYIWQRPHWLVTDRKKQVFLDKKFLVVGFPCLALAYLKEEDLTYTVPVDVIEMEDEENVKPLILSPGEYYVMIKGLEGQSKELPLKVE